jgi:LmbE family N-acetylglucosaminyl deacetylase
VLALHLGRSETEVLSVLAVGAHPDDIEIGAGGTAINLAETYRQLEVYYLVLTGTPERQQEARHAARTLFDSADLTIDLRELREGRFPGEWAAVKEALEDVATSFSPDLVLGPSAHDAHQDHRTIAQILPTVFRDALHLGYEIPKWDGDLDRPSMYVPLRPDQMHSKLELLQKCFPSQSTRDWWDDETFLGLARLRGVECRSRYAEAFTCAKTVILPAPAPRPRP